MTKKRKRLKPLVPRLQGEWGKEVVVMRIPAGTPPDELKKAREWQHNLAAKVSRSREHDYDKGGW